MGSNETVPQKKAPPPGEGASHLDIGELTKIGAVSAALAYGTGMLTINTYLHKIGITDFSLAKPKLILTGILVILSFSLLALPAVFVAWQLAEPGSPKPPHSRKLFFLLFFPFLAVFGASLYLCFGTTGLGQITVWGIWELIHQITVWVGWDLKRERNFFTGTLASLGVTIEVYAPICLAAVSAFLAARQLRRPGTKDDSLLNPKQISLFLCAALAVISVLLYMIVFSLTFYAAIPPAFGGGKPYFQSFVIAEDGRCQLQQLGIPFLSDAQSNVTKPLPVLHDSDTTVAVWLEEKEDAIRLQCLSPGLGGTPTSDASTGSAHDEARWQAIVVQLDRKEITASMADPSETTTPQLISPPVPCKRSSTTTP